MEPFEMDVPSVTTAGGALGSLASAVTAVAGAGAVSGAALVPVFGLVGGDYVAGLLGAVTATDAELVRLAAFYASAAAGAAQTVASAATAEAGGAAAVLGFLGGAL